MTAVLVLCTCPDGASADRIASHVVEARLAACVNRIGGVVSTYRWKGAVQRDDEVLLLIKSTRERYPQLRDAIVTAHPSELPEVIAVDIALGLDRYLEWLAVETAPDASHA
jgi:periplasmic divalent cation tolerance protein